ncbi:hypothetical protein [Streptomyces sp. NPDC018031]|uniref:hypothetical protein n=1 Tax=Streptomyces sp. NPDC018031 TaxID=3365033 RepID=UPI0037A5C482
MHRSPRTVPGAGDRRLAAAALALVAALTVLVAVFADGGPARQRPAAAATGPAVPAEPQHAGTGHHADDAGFLAGPTTRARGPRDPAGERTEPPGHPVLPSGGSIAAPPGPAGTPPSAGRPVASAAVHPMCDRGRAPPPPPGS